VPLPDALAATASPEEKSTSAGMASSDRTLKRIAANLRYLKYSPTPGPKLSRSLLTRRRREHRHGW
jgi:hypothetical protein